MLTYVSPPSSLICLVLTLVWQPAPFQLPFMGLGSSVATIPKSSQMRCSRKRATHRWSPISMPSQGPIWNSHWKGTSEEEWERNECDVATAANKRLIFFSIFFFFFQILLKHSVLNLSCQHPVVFCFAWAAFFVCENTLPFVMSLRALVALLSWFQQSYPDVTLARTYIHHTSIFCFSLVLGQFFSSFQSDYQRLFHIKLFIFCSDVWQALFSFQLPFFFVFWRPTKVTRLHYYYYIVLISETPHSKQVHHQLNCHMMLKAKKKKRSISLVEA